MFKNLAVWLVIGLVLMTVFNQFNSNELGEKTGGGSDKPFLL